MEAKDVFGEWISIEQIVKWEKIEYFKNDIQKRETKFQCFLEHSVLPKLQWSITIEMISSCNKWVVEMIDWREVWLYVSRVLRKLERRKEVWLKEWCIFKFYLKNFISEQLITGMIFKYLEHKLGFLWQEDTWAKILSK